MSLSLEHQVGEMPGCPGADVIFLSSAAWKRRLWGMYTERMGEMGEMGEMGR
jgi:hypothetical protein